MNPRQATAHGTAPAAHASVVRVLIVDDQPYFRSAAREVVAAMSGFEMVGEADSGEQAVELVGERAPDLVLLDVRMPGMGGIAAAAEIKARRPGTVVILIAMEDVAGVPVDAEACGAAALVRKQDFGPSVLRGLWALHGSGAA